MKHHALQSFEPKTEKANSKERLELLRKEMLSRGLDAFFVPHTDEHQNEYVPPSSQRLNWLTDFSGSAGLAIVTRDQCVLFVDGRYILQARDEVDQALITVLSTVETSVEKWLQKNVQGGLRVGYHGWLHTAREIESYSKIINTAKATLVSIEQNPIDNIWADRPAPPSSKITLHELKYAGETADHKIMRTQGAILDAKCEAIVVTDPHAIAWLFNIRGSDVAHTPICLSYAIVMSDERPKLFVAPEKLDASSTDALSKLAELYDPSAFDAALFVLGRSGMTVRVDPSRTPERVRAFLAGGGAKVNIGPDIIEPLKAIKNKTEIDGTRTAHKRDGEAMVRFLYWLDKEAPKGTLTEISAAQKLEELRHDSKQLVDLSFPTIAGAGANGAIVHYRPTTQTNAPLTEGSLFLIDSGAQYRDGTTDITRTIAIGEPTAEMKDRFTRVLKGHIALASSRFPEGTPGAQLDPFARRYLWEIGLDYDHGTGHGVGSFLSVHEGPARISKAGSVALEPGMILSNEPGYYKTGEYGIRIENLMLVTQERIEGASRPIMGFETLTLAPIDRNLIDATLMTTEEVAWLNAYHQRVYEAYVENLNRDEKNWLSAACEPLKVN